MEIAALAISGVSLIIAIVSFFVSTKSQRLQDQVNAIELKLKKLELAEKEEKKKKAPCIEARINHITKNNYRIKIWNSGNSIAKNIVASWDKGTEIIFCDNDKMPFEFLGPQKSFDLGFSVYDGSPSKIKITTRWEDEDGEGHSKTQWCDL